MKYLKKFNENNILSNMEVPEYTRTSVGMKNPNVDDIVICIQDSNYGTFDTPTKWYIFENGKKYKVVAKGNNTIDIDTGKGSSEKFSLSEKDDHFLPFYSYFEVN